MSLSRSLSGAVQTLVKTVTGKDKGVLLWQRDLVVPAEEIAKAVDARLTEFQANAKLPGFRKGKAPLDVVRSRYGDAAWSESLGEAILKVVSGAIQEENLRPAASPEIEIRKAMIGEDVEINVALDLLPDLDRDALKALEVERPVVRDIDSIVDRQLERTAEVFPATVPIEEERPAATKDFVRIDMKAFVGGKEVGEQLKDFRVEIDAETLSRGQGQVLKNLIGSKPGDHVSVDMPSPDLVGGAGGSAGKKTVLEIDVLGLEKRADETPVDDELARRAGAENLTDLRTRIEKKIREQCDAAGRNVAGMRALNALVAANRITISDRTIARYTEAWSREAAARAGGPAGQHHHHDHDHDHDQDHGHGHGDGDHAHDHSHGDAGGAVVAGADEDPTRTALVSKVSQAQATLDRLVHAVADSNGIVVQQAEAAMMFVQSGGLMLLNMDQKQFAEDYQKNPERYEEILMPVRERLVREKVVGWLLENVKIAEVEVSEDDLGELVGKTRLDFETEAEKFLERKDETADAPEQGASEQNAGRVS